MANLDRSDVELRPLALPAQPQPRRVWRGRILAAGVVGLALIGAGAVVLHFQNASSKIGAVYCRPEGATWAEDDQGQNTGLSYDTYASHIAFGMGPKDGDHLQYTAVVTDRPAMFGLPDLGHTFKNHQRLNRTAAAISTGQYEEQFDNSAFEGHVYYNQTISTTDGEAVNFGIENDDPACVGRAANDVSSAGAACRHQYFQLIVRPRADGQNMTMFDSFNQQNYICKRHP